MEIAEFLLARIAEDEVATWELVPYSCEPECCAPAGWVGHRCLICGTEEFGGTVEAITDIAREHDERIHRRPRVLAECEAKRRIVERLSGYLSSEHDPEPEGAWELLDDHAWATLYDLALPYADHPDYDPEWKP